MGSSGYRSVRTIAKGGMAEVALAVQTGLAGFEKLVVIKRILPHLCSDGQFVQMFLDEARLAASLRHPNIVQIYDVQRDEETFSIVMEYLQGEDLRFIVRTQARQRRYLPVPIVCRVIADVAAGLDAAHRATDAHGRPKEIVHRDVSPTNVIVTYDGVAKVLDFGVAKANVHNIYTAPGALKGKLSYASPEQIEHKGVDARSDIFSLAVVTWELLTARRLFRGDTSAAILHAVMQQEVVPPSSYNRRVPPELDHVVLSALRRDREERTHTAGLFRTQLEWVLKHMGEAITNHDVADWMREAFAERYAQRLKLERESAAVSSETEVEAEPLKPMFTLVKDPSHEGASPEVPTPAQASVPAAAAPQSTARVVVITALATLTLVGLVIGAYWVGRHDPATVAAQQGAPPAQPPAGAKPAAPAPPTAARPAVAVAAAGPASGQTGARKVVSKPRPTSRPAINARQGAPAKRAPSEASPVTGRPPTPEGRAVGTEARRPRDRRPTPRRRARADKPTAAKAVRRTDPPAKRSPPGEGESPPAPARLPTFPVLAEPPTVKRTEPARDRQPEPAPDKRPSAEEQKPAADRAPNGAVRVVSETQGYVFVDGQHTGKSTPVLLRLPPGEHEISVVIKGSNTRLTQKVRVRAQATVRLKFVE